MAISLTIRTETGALGLALLEKFDDCGIQVSTSAHRESSQELLFDLGDITTLLVALGGSTTIATLARVLVEFVRANRCRLLVDGEKVEFEGSAKKLESVLHVAGIIMLERAAEAALDGDDSNADPQGDS